MQDRAEEHVSPEALIYVIWRESHVLQRARMTKFETLLVQLHILKAAECHCMKRQIHCECLIIDLFILFSCGVLYSFHR